MTDFIEVLRLIAGRVLWRRDCTSMSGATRYQVVHSTTVSGGCRCEEDNRHNIRRYRQSHDCSAFIFCHNSHRDTADTEPKERRMERDKQLMRFNFPIYLSRSLLLPSHLCGSVAIRQPR